MLRCMRPASTLVFVLTLCSGAPASAGVIPFVYNAIFGYGPIVPRPYAAPYQVGYAPQVYSMGYAPYAGGYTVGYAPNFGEGFSQFSYSAGYGPAWGGAVTSLYGPAWDGCGCNPCCNPCGGACSNCAGGDCGTGGAQSNYGPNTDGEPTPAKDSTQELPKDQFQQRESVPIPSRNQNQPGNAPGWNNSTDRPATPANSGVTEEVLPNLQTPRPAPGEPGGVFPGNFNQGTGGEGQQPGGFPNLNETNAAPAEPTYARARFMPTRSRLAVKSQSDATQQVAQSEALPALPAPRVVQN
jgi:hypothetical protein